MFLLPALLENNKGGSHAEPGGQRPLCGATKKVTGGPRRPLVIAGLRGGARGYVFSAALPASAVAAAHAALDLLETEGEQRRGDPSGNISYFLHRTRAAGIPLPVECRSGVLPVLIGDERRALETADHCRRHGVMVVPFVWPVCARGAVRLRVNVTARHTRLDIDTAVTRIAAALEATAP
ncbi:aminotransferase class I/II-fold pyridoxal phosphate-dependent enzyme [Streptomyces sp. TRM70308]|uniref:aminotransferase class I/II-fold pyridoxal phosphate-dependent enzyme n=1 Tax=Streptomyces sp. TRM70308 TaxID=3131932 RepID=UPI003D094015